MTVSLRSTLPFLARRNRMRLVNRVSALLAAIPPRSQRALRGTPLPLPRDPAARESRIAYLSQMLTWLTPFSELGPEGQRALGLLVARDKPMDRDEDEHDDELRR
jgi:hypothetical protein